MVTCYAKYKSSKRITSGGLGTMGFALPAAIGASFGEAVRTVVAVIGDGGFEWRSGAGAIMQSEANVKIILILNNQFLGIVNNGSNSSTTKYSFVDIASPDYVQVAKRISWWSKSGQAGTIRTTMQTILEQKGSYLEVMVGKEDNVLFPWCHRDAPSFLKSN